MNTFSWLESVPASLIGVVNFASIFDLNSKNLRESKQEDVSCFAPPAVLNVLMLENAQLGPMELPPLLVVLLDVVLANEDIVLLLLKYEIEVQESGAIVMLFVALGNVDVNVELCCTDKLETLLEMLNVLVKRLHVLEAGRIPSRTLTFDNASLLVSLGCTLMLAMFSNDVLLYVDMLETSLTVIPFNDSKDFVLLTMK